LSFLTTRTLLTADRIEQSADTQDTDHRGDTGFNDIQKQEGSRRHCDTHGSDKQGFVHRYAWLPRFSNDCHQAAAITGEWVFTGWDFFVQPILRKRQFTMTWRNAGTPPEFPLPFTGSDPDPGCSFRKFIPDRFMPAGQCLLPEHMPGP
jgi:hypothetical protein